MNKKTKRIIFKRKIREVMTVNHRETIIGVCENCRREQIFEVIGINETVQIDPGSEVGKLSDLTERK